MHWAWSSTGLTGSEPLTTAEAKSHLRITSSDEDTLIDTYVSAARQWMELYLNRSIPQQTIVCVLDEFPHDGQHIRLPQSPASAITSIQYVDTDGDTQVWGSSNYTLDTYSEPSRAEAAYNVSYPSTRPQHNAVTITYTAGYSTIPADIKHALKMVVGSLYMMRETECPQQLYSPDMGIKRILANHKLYYRGPWIC